MPTELERWFRGIRELDEKAHALQLQLEADCLAQLRVVVEEAPAGKRARATPGSPADVAKTGHPSGEASEIAQRIENTTAELLRLCAEKVCVG